MTDYGATYTDLRERVSSLARARSADLDAVAPAAPQWRARDVLAHLAGVCDDVVNGNLDGVGTNRWTAAQVDKRRDWSVDRLLDEWDEHGTGLAQVLGSFPEVIVGQMLFDATTHEHDFRGALDQPGARDSDAVEVGYEWATDRFGDAGNGTFTFVTENGEKTVGSGDRVFGVGTTRFELVRAFTGRRSFAQMQAYEWDGPAMPERLVVADFFTPPARDLIE